MQVLPRPLVTRIFWTAGTFVALWLAQRLPLPFLDPVFVRRAETLAPQLMRGVFTVTSIGCTAILIGYVLVELVALALPGLRRRRRLDPRLRRQLTVWSLLVGVTLALVQAWLLAVYFESLGAQGQPTVLGAQPLVATPGIWFRLVVVLTLTAGATLFVAAALVISEKGVGAGFPVMMLGALASDLPSSLAAIRHAVARGALTPMGLAALVSVLGVVIWGSLRVLGRKGRMPGGLCLQQPVCGAAPLAFGTALLSAVVFLGSVGTYSGLALVAAVVVVTGPALASVFYWRYRKERCEAGGIEVWRRLLVQSCGFLIGLAIADHFLARLDEGAGVTLPSMLMVLWVTAVAADLGEELRARALSPEDLERVAVYHDVADALADTRGHDVVIQGLRTRALGHFFLPFIPLVVLARKPAR